MILQFERDARTKAIVVLRYQRWKSRRPRYWASARDCLCEEILLENLLVRSIHWCHNASNRRTTGSRPRWAAVKMIEIYRPSQILRVIPKYRRRSANFCKQTAAQWRCQDWASQLDGEEQKAKDRRRWLKASRIQVLIHSCRPRTHKTRILMKLAPLNLSRGSMSICKKFKIQNLKNRLTSLIVGGILKPKILVLMEVVSALVLSESCHKQ